MRAPSAGEPASGERRGTRASGVGALLGLAFAAAFSPLLADLGTHLLAEPWARYALLFPFLLAVAARRAPRSAPAPVLGTAALAAAAALELLAFASGLERFARPGLALGLVGLLRLTGAAPLRVALLALWIVPVPWLLVSAASPALETALLRAAAALSAPLGAGGEAWSALPPDGGVPLAALLSGLGWFAGLRRPGWGPPLLGAAAGAALALPLQTLALAAALLVAQGGSAEAARAALRHGLAPAAALGGLAAAALWGRPRREGRP